LHEKNQRNFPGEIAGNRVRPEEAVCALCEGELYPGDRYFALDGQKICEVCLAQYARDYFSGQLRRIEKSRGGAV